MKRFKKLTIYILVGVLLSSSVMLSYRKADEVKAAATLTLGTGALIMLGILGAYGLVYKGNIDSALDEYVWKGDRGLYPHEVQEAEEWWAQMWDNTVRQYASNNGYDPDNWNDEDNDLETQPPLWEKVIGTVEKNKRHLKLLATAFGAIASKLAFGVYQESQKPKEGNIFYGNGEIYATWHYVKSSGLTRDSWRRVTIQNSNSFIKYVMVHSDSSNDQCGLLIYSDSPFDYICKTEVYPDSSSSSKASSYGSWYFVYTTDSWSTSYGTPKTSSLPIIVTTHEFSSARSTSSFIDTLEADDTMIWTEDFDNINQESIGLGTDITIDNSNNELKPISPTITIPTASMFDKLLNDLENNYGNEGGTQQAVDDFIADLEYTEPNPEPDPDPEPNPNPEGGGGTTTDPDDGGEGGSGSTDDKDNSSLLADLKNVFPFCIPFDLINCFKLFNAEPVTPRVEIPLHFGIIDKDYTFVIDLKDFDGVAEVCRAMFLILFIVGLVLSTRSLIRG